MGDVVWAAACAGAASAFLALLARRLPLLAWIALTPLGMGLSTCGGWTALGGALFGSLLHGAVTLTQPARLRPLGFLFGSLGWGLTAGAAGMLLDSLRSVQLMPESVALALVLPLVVVSATLPMRLAGAPRWIHAALACTQEPWPVVIRAGWFGGDMAVSVLLSLSAAAACALLPGRTRAPGLTMLIGLFVLATLASSAWSLARTRRAIDQQRRVRVAAVVVNGAPPEGAAIDGLWPLRSPAYRDVEATIARYEPYIVRAASEGAELIVLPEAALVVEGDGVRRWLDAVTCWARDLNVTVVEPSGRRWEHDKQHPAPGLEPAPRRREPPGPCRLERGWSISSVICVDLDYADLIAPVRAAGGLLVVPANDWPSFDKLHDRTAIWAAVLSQTTVLRATGHGICSAYDGAGRALARASSLEGPTVLLVDAPITLPPRQPG
jgi:hypothetical protein